MVMGFKAACQPEISLINPEKTLLLKFIFPVIKGERQQLTAKEDLSRSTRRLGALVDHVNRLLAQFPVFFVFSLFENVKGRKI